MFTHLRVVNSESGPILNITQIYKGWTKCISDKIVQHLSMKDIMVMIWPTWDNMSCYNSEDPWDRHMPNLPSGLFFLIRNCLPQFLSSNRPSPVLREKSQCAGAPGIEYIVRRGSEGQKSSSLYHWPNIWNIVHHYTVRSIKSLTLWRAIPAYKYNLKVPESKSGHIEVNNPVDNIPYAESRNQIQTHLCIDSNSTLKTGSHGIHFRLSWWLLLSLLLWLLFFHYCCHHHMWSGSGIYMKNFYFRYYYDHSNTAVIRNSHLHGRTVLLHWQLKHGSSAIHIRTSYDDYHLHFHYFYD